MSNTAFVEGMMWISDADAPIVDRIRAALKHHAAKYGPVTLVYAPAGCDAPEAVDGVPVEPLHSLMAGYLLVAPGPRGR